MNLVIHNIGHYRLTNYGRGEFQLFNRESDLVLSISEENYGYIRSAENHSDALTSCLEVENETLDEMANGIVWPVATA